VKANALLDVGVPERVKDFAAVVKVIPAGKVPEVRMNEYLPISET
jgi:hypothetical protein